MKAKLFSGDGTAKGDLNLPDAVFNTTVNDALLHQVATMYQANRRQGTAKAKGRSEVSGGTGKPWKQKGTGRARAGSNTSPVWVRGGKSFGPQPRTFTRTIPRKLRIKALTSALTSRAQAEKIVVFDRIACEEAKTKQIAVLLRKAALDGNKNLLILDAGQDKVYLSSRNIERLQVKPLSELNALDVLLNENIIFGAEELIGKIEEAVAK
ncbi:MAG: 50S ribosomal protein L4 [Chitinivibrionales bacterium]|nr:50S ribosomal protein L4 [Chitinivibrionales bacterium]